MILSYQNFNVKSTYPIIIQSWKLRLSRNKGIYSIMHVPKDSSPPAVPRPLHF